MRVALVHDWLVAQRGGENVLLEIARFFPAAPIFTLVHRPGSAHPELEARRIHTSFIQRLPGAPARFRPYLPLFPRAIEAFDLKGFDVVISTSHCVAKGVRTRPDQIHLAYIHTPMRYIWDELPSYAGHLTPLARLVTRGLRRWDVESAQRPTMLLANSKFVSQRIASYWGRAARVIYPPVDVDFFAQAQAQERRGYLVVSALVPYKRVDLAVQLARAQSLELTVIGGGPEEARLRKLAGPTVRFLPTQSGDALRQAYAGATALLYPGTEDFGIIPVEALAAGCPVIAFGRGGATETQVADGVNATGVLYSSPTLDGVAVALERFHGRQQQGLFGRPVLERQARRFDTAAFRHNLGSVFSELGVQTAQTQTPGRGRSSASPGTGRRNG